MSNIMLIYFAEEWVFSFEVKFYPNEPSTLKENSASYLAMQIRSDLGEGKLPCSFVTYALLGAFSAQAEVGDYDEEEHGNDASYIKEYQFAPQQTTELLQKISELHKVHR